MGRLLDATIMAVEEGLLQRTLARTVVASNSVSEGRLGAVCFHVVTLQRLSKVW